MSALQKPKASTVTARRCGVLQRALVLAAQRAPGVCGSAGRGPRAPGVGRPRICYPLRPPGIWYGRCESSIKVAKVAAKHEQRWYGSGTGVGGGRPPAFCGQGGAAGPPG